MDKQYTIDTNNLVFEIFDHEVVLVSLESGHYFVLDQVAGDVWRCLASGLSVSESNELLSQRYDIAIENLQQDIEGLLDQLLDEDILQPCNERQAEAEGLTLPAASSPALPYEEPSLFKYTEMENLIQMDPIREVDESGWPKRRTFPKKNDK